MAFDPERVDDIKTTDEAPNAHVRQALQCPNCGGAIYHPRHAPVDVAIQIECWNEPCGWTGAGIFLRTQTR